MSTYKVLKQQSLSLGEYSIVPIRLEDRYDIMEWRNEQMYHLRQNEPLTKEKQDVYFDSVISNLFEQNQPSQILFSYLEGEKCIGYGGLVHINWIDKNAEISFVMDTSLEKDFFEELWVKFLMLIEKVAFNELNFHKIFTYAYDLRPRLYKALNSREFIEDARLKDHVCFNGEFIDVLIHSKFKFYQLSYREATIRDLNLLYEWVNEDDVRLNSLNSEKIDFQNHSEWFQKRIKDENCKIFIFFKDDSPVGQLRLDRQHDYWIIDYSVDKHWRGQGYGSRIISTILNSNNYNKLKAVVKSENFGSLKVFKKFGFTEIKTGDNSVIEFILHRQ